MACQVGASSGLASYIFYHLHFYFQCYGRFPFELEYNTIVSTLNRHGDTILLHNYMKSYRAFSYPRNNNNEHGASLGDAPWLAESVGGARAGNLNVVWPLLPTFWHQYTFFLAFFHWSAIFYIPNAFSPDEVECKGFYCIDKFGCNNSQGNDWHLPSVSAEPWSRLTTSLSPWMTCSVTAYFSLMRRKR